MSLPGTGRGDAGSAPELPSLSVVIPAYGRYDLVEQAVSSVDVAAEVIVVDDCSPGGVPDGVESWSPGLRLIRNPVNLGFGATANRGLAAAGGQVRVVLNSDARPRPGALSALLEAFRGDPAVGIAGPRLVFPDGSHQLSAARDPTAARVLAGSFALNDAVRGLFPGVRFPWEFGMSRVDHASSHDVDWVMGACICIRDVALADVEGFDTNYYMYLEEADLCYRARQGGWKIRYVAEAVVEHEGHGSGRDPAEHARRLVSSERRYFEKTYGPASLRGWRRSRLLGSVLKMAAFSVPALLDRRLRDRFRWHWAAVQVMRSVP
ncbi:MAG TPA: glycosyltransferase family 2 protein [Acidimicrobiales bacterium]|nr:glycosyltransferase family 2 protein [Acidimicrobiales bacterium]